MNRILGALCLAGLVVGCTSISTDNEEEVGHDGFELISITRVRVISFWEDESTFKAVYRITNKSDRNLLCVNHLYFLDWQVQNSASEDISPTIVFKLGPPSPKEVETIPPGESKVFTTESLPFKNSNLGFSPRARLRFCRWSISDLSRHWSDKTKLEGICFPTQSFSSSWR